MTTLQRLCEALESRLDSAIAIEQQLGRKLGEQEGALLRGETARILALNSELDRFLVDLKQTSFECRVAAAELLAALDLPDRTALKDAIAELPTALGQPLLARRTQLVAARKAAREASAKNAAIARTSLDAIASVRSILSQAAGGETGASTQPAPLSRLDARA